MSLNASTREYVQRLVLTTLIIALALAIWELRGALMLTFLAVIIAAGLARPVSLLQKRGLSRSVAMLVVLGTVFGLMALVLVAIVPVFIKQISALIDELPVAVENSQAYYNDLAKESGFLPSFAPNQVINEGDVSEFLLTQAGSASRSVLPFLSNVGGIITNLFVIITMAIFILSEPKTYVEGLLTLVPRHYRSRALEVINALGDAITTSLMSQLIAMIFIGALTTLGLLILGVPNAVALGVIAGLLAFIPTFGATVSILFGVMFTLASEPEKLVLVLLLYIGIQQAEANIITPRIVKRTLNLPGALVIVTQIVAGILFGFLGLVLAVPLVAVLMVLVRELYVFDALNSRPAKIETVQHESGGEMVLISNEPYRPEQLSPGEAAALVAQGRDPFEYAAQTHRIEIINPSDRQVQQVTRGQQAVWVAILALVAAQTLSFLRALLITENRNR